ncbi:hypothetical protein HMPREF1552_00125 [Leptotrichia sp. oral taxon 879 str. F0557]|nr:hypothetical protein HMPREF1552_00125 [Leptotrichia sp. oral taxon 879 str. F0557]
MSFSTSFPKPTTHTTKDGYLKNVPNQPPSFQTKLIFQFI